MRVAFGTRKVPPIRCGWMDSTWENHFMRNGLRLSMKQMNSMTWRINLFGWKAMLETTKRVYYITPGMRAEKLSGLKQLVIRLFSGAERWAGMAWLWSMCWNGFQKVIIREKR